MRKVFKNISWLANFDEYNVWENAYIVVKDNIIEEIGTGEVSEECVDEVIDCEGYLVIPGFVNTHHHLYQSLFRNIPQVQSEKLFSWLTFLYELWKNIDYESVYISTVVAIYEMMLSGVTTTTDMLYLYPNGKNELFDAEVEGAKRTGIRFHPTRGSMSLSRKNGGLPPDSVVQREEEILSESERVIKEYHDPDDLSMLKIALAPCSPFSVSPELMKSTAELAEKFNVLLHTHLAETKDEEEFCLEKFQRRPVDYMEELGWLNPRTWFAHVVWVNDEDIEKMSKADVGIAHCPVSNMRLGSGIAPIFKMKNKVRVGIAVDGSASNDSNNMLQEIRTAMLLQRVKYGAGAMTPVEVLKMATSGGSSVLRMNRVGKMKEGMAADFIGFRMDRIEFAGALSDPIGAIVMCDAKSVDFSVVNGEFRIREGRILDDEIDYLIRRHNEISARLIGL